MSDLPMGTLLSNRYHIRSPLGSGGFGVTYLARDLDLPGHPECVVKQLKINSQDSQIFSIAQRLFKKEANILQQLGHHNQIPRLLAYFDQNREFYLVQDYVDGEDLTNQLVQFDEKKTFSLMREVLEVLRFVHEAHVIHRDIKPSNLMRRKIDGKLVVIDFGAVKEIENQATIIETKGATQTICIGTPGYAPLEQMAGDPQYNSDIFALGMVGIMALTGIKDPLRIPKDPRTYEFMWQEQVRSPVSLQFIEVLSKMVLCDFRSRYQTVVEVLNDLDRIAPSEATVPATVQEKRGYSTAYDETVALAEAAVPETVQLNEGHNKNTIRKNSQGRSNAATPKWMLYLPLGLGLGVLGGVLGLALIAVWLEPPSPDQSIPLDTYRYRSARIDDAGNIASFAESAQVYVEKSMNLPPGAVPLEMVKIPAGSFVMGSPASEVGRNDDEDPKRWVTVPAFLMGRFEVTQAQYEAVMGTNPSHFNGINLPVEHINWYEAQEFIDRLNEMTGKNYRLPTEAEWEYAARARTESPFSYGETINSRLANFNEASDLNSNEVQESGRPTQEVDSLYPNPWGLYHVHGNVWEWVEDYWQNNYADAPTDGGAQLTGNSQGYKVLRGGSSESNIRQIRSASRLAVNPDGSFYDAGFRLVLTLE